VFVLVGVESLGIPLPGETAVIVAGAYAGHTHRLSPSIIFAVASVSAIIGDNVGFWIGDRGGYRLARKFGRRIHLDDRKLKIGRYLFDTHGVEVVFVGRFVSILRTYAAFLAGANRMRWSRFLPANAAGAIVWAGIYSFASYVGGNALTHLSGTISLAVGGVAILALGAALVFLRGEMDKLALRAEAAYPGPLE
jgi:membrane protein DedA with SNARE-associated domain